MEKAEYPGLYAKGWTEGDVNVVLQSLADEYIMDDPNSGHISKADFSSYFTSFKNGVDPIRDKTVLSWKLVKFSVKRPGVY